MNEHRNEATAPQITAEGRALTGQSAPDPYAHLIIEAADLGRHDGESAASWYVIESEAHARAIVEDIDHTYPRADLSGEWAGWVTADDIYLAVVGYHPSDVDPDDPDDIGTDAVDLLRDALADAYCDTFDETVADLIDEAAARYLADLADTGDAADPDRR